MTGSYDITIRQGETFSLQMTWSDENGSPIDLTGYTARLQARSDIDAPDPFITLTTGSGITLGGAAGTITLAMSATATAALTQTIGVYDLELVAGSVVTRLLAGSVILEREVTR